MEAAEKEKTNVFISVSEIARVTGAHRDSVWRWVVSGRIKPQAICDGHVPLFAPEYIEAFNRSLIERKKERPRGRPVGSLTTKPRQKKV